MTVKELTEMTANLKIAKKKGGAKGADVEMKETAP